MSSSLLIESEKILTHKDVIQIKSVLDYWFYDNDIAFNYKNRWFPGTISHSQQQITDKEIYLNFNELYQLASQKNLTHWQQSTNGTIALIIILDQFSRHILRWLGNGGDDQRISDMIALEISKSLHSKRSVLNLSVSEYVFSLMPMRHASTAIDLRCVLEKLSLKENIGLQSQELLNKFRKQTTRKLQHLQDREVLEATDDILERHALSTDESTAMQHLLVTATEAFLIQRFIPTSHSYTILISLSGGDNILTTCVDSMVISKILKLLQLNKPGLKINQIVAMHIDYANRPESEREALYVKQKWCEEILDITCKVRKVAEVTRGVTNRDDYEKISRDIRYDFYRQCIEEANTSERSQVSGVIFGHHLGDIQENVISNIMRGANPLYLSGMVDCSTTNGVNVWRPLLKYKKDEIYNFAHRYGVPYFKDSTPSWSTRGKLRNQLLPLLQDMYGAGCLQNLTQLAQESDETKVLVQNNLYEPFMRDVIQFSCGTKVNIVAYRLQPQCFWREALKQLMHSMGMSMVRDKAVSNFVERLQKPGAKIHPGWLELRKGFHTLLSKDGDLIILRDGCLKNNQNIQLHTPNTFNQRKQQLKAKQKLLTVPQNLKDASILHAILELEEAINAILIMKVHFDENNCKLEYDREKFSSLNKLDFQSISKSTSDSYSNTCIRLGPWLIETQTNKDLFIKGFSLVSIEDILPGYFVYETVVPMNMLILWYQVEIVRVLYSEVVLQFEISEHLSSDLLELHRRNILDLMNKELEPNTSLCVNSLLNDLTNREYQSKSRCTTTLDYSSIDSRLMYGLPLLLPAVQHMGELNDDNKCHNKLQLKYTYVK